MGFATPRPPRAALGACAALLALAGCVTRPPPAMPGPGAGAPWPQQLAALRKLDSFALNGRVAVAAKGEGFTASLRYRQEKRHADLSFDGPLGIGGLRMQLEGAQLRVTNSKGQQLDDVAARAELERRLGFELPLAELRWWLLGVPAPGASAALDGAAVDGAPPGFEQNGWRVRVEARAPGLGFSLPRKLTAERVGAGRDGARLKLFVDRWQP